VSDTKKKRPIPDIVLKRGLFMIFELKRGPFMILAVYIIVLLFQFMSSIVVWMRGVMQQSLEYVYFALQMA
jgi:hypothetical protein